MANKKKQKWSKRALKCLRKKVWEDYRRKKKEEIESLEKTPVEQVGQLNFDVEFENVPNVLDIKVEEPEVTCNGEGDYPCILLDHPYSRIIIKDEPDWNVEYSPSTAQACKPQSRPSCSFGTAVALIRGEVQSKGRNSTSKKRDFPAESQGSAASGLSTKDIRISKIKNEPINQDNAPETSTSSFELGSYKMGARRRSVRLESINKTNAYVFCDEHNYTKPPCPRFRQVSRDESSSSSGYKVEDPSESRDLNIDNCDRKMADLPMIFGTPQEEVFPKRRTSRTRNRIPTSPNAPRRSQRIQTKLSQDFQRGVAKLEVLEDGTLAQPIETKLMFDDFGTDQKPDLTLQSPGIPAGILIPMTTAIPSTSSGLSYTGMTSHDPRDPLAGAAWPDTLTRVSQGTGNGRRRRQQSQTSPDVSPKKPSTSILRVKTQDEINASLLMKSREPHTSSSRRTKGEVNVASSSSARVEDDELSGYMKSKRKLKFPRIVKSGKRFKPSFSTDTSEGNPTNKIRVKLNIPVDRVIESVPQKWKDRFLIHSLKSREAAKSGAEGNNQQGPTKDCNLLAEKFEAGPVQPQRPPSYILKQSRLVAVNIVPVTEPKRKSMDAEKSLPSFMVQRSTNNPLNTVLIPVQKNQGEPGTSSGIQQKHGQLRSSIEIIPIGPPGDAPKDSGQLVRKKSKDLRCQKPFQNTISECVDNIIQTILIDSDDVEEEEDESRGKRKNRPPTATTSSPEMSEKNFALGKAAPVDGHHLGNAKTVNDPIIIDLTDRETPTNPRIPTNPKTSKNPKEDDSSSTENRKFSSEKPPDRQEICIIDDDDDDDDKEEDDLPIIQEQDLEELLGISDDAEDLKREDKHPPKSMVIEGRNEVFPPSQDDNNKDVGANRRNSDENLHGNEKNCDDPRETTVNVGPQREAISVKIDFDLISLEKRREIMNKAKFDQTRTKPNPKVRRKRRNWRKILSDQIRNNQTSNAGTGLDSSGFPVDEGEFDDYPQRRSARLKGRQSKVKNDSPKKMETEGERGNETVVADEVSVPEIDITELLFTREHFCKLCRTDSTNLSSHLLQVHYDKDEVRAFSEVPTGSDARRRTLKKWYLTANYTATVESKFLGVSHRRCCSICLKSIPQNDTLSHYFRCVSEKVKGCNSVPITQEDVLVDLDRLIVEIQKEFSLEIWLNLAKSLVASIYVLNGGLATIDMLLITDYNKRRLFNIELDLKLVEMLEDVVKIRRDINPTMKIIIQRNVIGMPLLLTAKHEEGIELLMITRKKYGGCYVFTNPFFQFKKRLSILEAVKNYIQIESIPTSVLEMLGNQEKVWMSSYEIHHNVSRAKPKRKRNAIKFTWRKGRRSPKKTNLQELFGIKDAVVVLNRDVDETVPAGEGSDSDVVVDQSLMNVGESKVEDETICLPEDEDDDDDDVNDEMVDVSHEENHTKIGVEVRVKDVLLEDVSLPQIVREESKNDVVPSGSGIEKKEDLTALKVTYKNHDVYRSFCLKTAKGSKRIVVDIRDTCVCDKCKKYFLRPYYFKHRKLCKTPRTGKTIRKRRWSRIETFPQAEDPKCIGNYQPRKPTCPTLQSPAGWKKYFCIFCKQTITKLHRHLEHKHKNEAAVKEMLSYPKRSKERDRILYKLRTQGTFAFNKNSEYNGGKIIVSRRPNPNLQRTSRDFLPCPHCHNYFAKNTLYRHTRRCSDKQGFQKDLRRTALALANPVHPRCNKIMANQIIPRLVEDHVSEAVKNDELLILFGNYLTRKHPYPTIRKEYIRQNLRLAAKFYLAMKAQNPSVVEFSSVYTPQHRDSIAKVVMEVAGYDAETGAFKTKEIFRKLGRIINNCGVVWSMECSKTKRFEDRRMAVEFLHKFNEIYKKDVLAKLRRPPVANQTSELKKMFQFSQDIMLKAMEQLKRDFSLDSWMDLANSSLVHLRLLNNNISQDGEGLYVSDYLQRHSLDLDEDVTSYHTLELLSNFPKNCLKVKLFASSAWFLFSQEFCNAVDVLLENREDAGVPIENIYVFGRPEQKDHFKTRDAKNYLRVKASKTMQSDTSASETKVEGDISKNDPKPTTTYSKNLRRTFDHNSNRMLELTVELRQNFTNPVWIDLVKCVLTCVQLMNDKTYAEVIQYLLLIDYDRRKKIGIGEDLSVYTTMTAITGAFFKLNLRGTPINLLLNSNVCQALDILIETRLFANIHPENPYVFGCSGNKFNYYRTEGCIGSLPVSNGVEEILTLRSRIINDLIKNGNPGIQLWKLLPESKEDLLENAIRVFYYSQSKMVELKYKLEEKFSTETWLDLIRCLLTYAHLLNNRTPEDAEKLLIRDYNHRQKLAAHEKKSSYHSLDDLSDFPQNYLKTRMGESDRFLLLGLEFCETIDVLLAHRQSAGVHVDNPYVFGCRGNKENYFRAHGVLAQVSAKCGVKRLKYYKAKRVNGKVEVQEQTVDVKDISKTEREILLNNWKIERILKASDSSDRADERETNFIPRRRWTEEEMTVAAKNFTNCLTKGYLPSVYQCQQVISMSPELRNRTPEQLKAWVNNQIQKRAKRNRAENADAAAPAAPAKPKSRAGHKGGGGRCRWTSVEQDLARLYFADHLLTRTLPSAQECRTLIASHAELSQRTPEQVRAWINNQNKKRGLGKC